MLQDHFDTANRRPHPGLQNLFRQLFLVERDYFLDIADAAAKILAQGNNLPDDNRRTRDRFHDAQLPALNPLGDFNLALASEQRNGTHLAQIHAHGVVCLLQRTGREIKFYILRLFAGLRLVFVAVAPLIPTQLNTLRVDRRQQVIQVIGRGDIAGQQVINLAKGEVTLLLANLYYVVFVFIQIFGHDYAHSCERISDSGRRLRGNQLIRPAFVMLTNQPPDKALPLVVSDAVGPDAVYTAWQARHDFMPGIISSGKVGHSKAHVPSESQNTTIVRRA